MNRLTKDKRIRVVSALVEGNSIRATVRMTGVAKNTVVKLLADLGMACAVYQDRTLQDLPCKRLQCDEIWSFCYAKSKNVPDDKAHEFGVGDVWTWTAIDTETKLVPTWFVGGRDAGAATRFMHDLASRIKGRVQLTTDGHQAYLKAVDSAFGDKIDFSMLTKLYGPDSNPNKPETRYSPARINGAKKTRITGNPDPEHVSTSYAERANLTMRMSMRRFTRLTNAFSKKVENHCCAIALHFMHYNFCRVHGTIKTTPAIKAGVADKVWSIGDLVGLLENKESN